MGLASFATQMAPPGPGQNIPAAAVGGGATNAVQIVQPVVRVASVATAADSVKLPVTFGGDTVLIFNDGAAACQVFGFGGATINGIAGATGISQAAGVAALYTSSMEGIWHRFLQG
jgi:hypothetical protein